VEKPAEALDPRRYELAGFPIIGGNSDIGVQFGGAATLTRFLDDEWPYAWNVDLLLSASLKNTDGLRLVQQSHVLRLDAPDLLGGSLRLDTRGSYVRTINAGYYGLGNASAAVPAPGQTDVGRRYQYTQQEGRLRAIARVHTGRVSGAPLDVALVGNLRLEAPEVYAGSKLAEDLTARDATGAAAIPGASSSMLLGVGAGLMLDTRDSEFVTTRGVFYQIGVIGTAGSAEDVGYGEAAAVLASYAPLGGPFIFASRIVASVQFGRIPFYDLQQAGVFEPQNLVGGESGVRGVPLGRYAGATKTIANVEVRSTPLPRFRFLGQRLRVGTTTFFDAGRVWQGPSAVSAADGRSLGLKYGVGGGLFLQWGEAAIFRVEVAYSPDAESENPGFPVGVYVADGLMF
jgi:hypothetical protein